MTSPMTIADAFIVNPKVAIPAGVVTPFVTMGDLEPFRREVQSNSTKAFSGGMKFLPGDVLMARITPCLENGKTSIYMSDDELPAAGSTEFIVIRGREGLSDTRFAYYLFTSPDMREFAISQMNGSSGRQRVQTSAFCNHIVELPALPVQREIAATLGALDDKIESNRLAVALILDLCAARFFRWKSRTVPVAESTFGGFADVYGGSTPKTDVPEYWGGSYLWATPSDVTALTEPYLLSTSRTITQAGLASGATALHPPGTIFMTSRATIGVFAVNQSPCAVNQGFIAVRPRRDSDRWFLFEEMRSRVGEMLEHSNGSTFQELSRGNFKGLPLDIPGDDDLAKLDQQLALLHAKASQLARENDRVRSLRDALMPELLAGRIRVSGAQNAVGVAS